MLNVSMLSLHKKLYKLCQKNVIVVANVTSSEAADDNAASGERVRFCFVNHFTLAVAVAYSCMLIVRGSCVL